MAKKRSTSNGSDFSAYKFVDVSLDMADKEWLHQANLVAEFPTELIFDLVSGGYKFSLSNDAKNQSFIATITDKSPGSAFDKHVLSARGSTATDAWHALAYKHFHKLQEDWSHAGNPGDGDGSKYG